MYFSEETKRQYELLKTQREVLISWDKYRSRMEERQKEEVKRIDTEEENLIGESNAHLEEIKPKLKRVKFKTYLRKNICIVLSIITFYVGYFIFSKTNVYAYHGVSLLGPFLFILLAMIFYRLDLVKAKDKGRIYKPIVDYLLIFLLSVPVMFLISKIPSVNGEEFFPILTAIPLFIDFAYIVASNYSWNKKMDACNIYNREINEKLKSLEDEKENVIGESSLDLKNKSEAYFVEEKKSIYLPTFTKGEDVEKLMSYFEEGRAETIKEAILIFYEEKRHSDLGKMLDEIMHKVDDMAVTEAELRSEMKNMRLATINQLGGVQEAIVGTIKYDRTAKMTSAQKKKYEKKIAKSAKFDELKDKKEELKKKREIEKKQELEMRHEEEIKRDEEREAMLLARREEKNAELEKKRQKDAEKEAMRLAKKERKNIEEENEKNEE